MAQPGSTRVWNSPSTSPPRTLTAPISVIALSFGDPPVVSRSTTTKVTSASGVPSSSIVACSKRGSPAAARAAVPARRAGESGTGRAGEARTGRTVGRGADSPGDARRVTGRAEGTRSSGGNGATCPGGAVCPPDTISSSDRCGPEPQRWSMHSLPRSRVVAALSLGVVALAVVLLPTAHAGADPTGSGVATASLLDSPELDELQRRAAGVQAELQERQSRVRAAREALAAAEAAAAQAEADIVAADADLARARAEVARHASAVYRDAGEVTPLSVLLSGGGPGDVVAAGGLLDPAERHAAAVGVAPPPAAALRDPAAGLPDGLVPVPASGGGVQAGVARLTGASDALVVPSAEAVAAVRAAGDALELPYAPGAAGPDAWSCGPLV